MYIMILLFLVTSMHIIQNLVKWYNKHRGKSFIYTTCNRLGLREIKHKPTFVVGNTASCIDLIFTNNPDMVMKLGVGCKIAKVCDHCPTYAVLRSGHAKSKPKCFERLILNFKEGNFDFLSYVLFNAPWMSLLWIRIR